MLRRLLKARGLETMQFSAQVLFSLYLNQKVSVRKDDNSHRKTTKFATPPHKGDISYGRLIKKTKMLKNMMKFVLFKFSVEWLFTIYEIRKG